MRTDEILASNRRATDGVSGWLLVLCAALTIFNPIGAVMALSGSYAAYQRFGANPPQVVPLLVADGVMTLVLAVMSVVAGLALWRLSSNAVQLARLFLVIALGYGVIFLGFYAVAESQLSSLSIPRPILDPPGYRAIARIVYGAFWLLYLWKSEQVAETFSGGS